MLLSETLKYDIRTIVLDPSAEAPARFGCHAFFQGDLMDYDTVYQFGKQADLLTFEIENVNVDALERLEQEGVKVYLTPASLRIIHTVDGEVVNPEVLRGLVGAVLAALTGCVVAVSSR